MLGSIVENVKEINDFEITLDWKWISLNAFTTRWKRLLTQKISLLVVSKLETLNFYSFIFYLIQ